MSIFNFKSITGVAKQALGATSQFRTILEAAPNLSKFTFPPQVQAGIAVAGVFGIKLPGTPQAAVDLILGKGKVDNILGSLKNTSTRLDGVIGQITVKINGVEKTANSVSDVLNSIDWLK
jgi:hypothetical protein